MHKIRIFCDNINAFNVVEVPAFFVDKPEQKYYNIIANSDISGLVARV